MTPIHERYMQRALDLARKGWPFAAPNPMVGAVITDKSGNIIGEGYHRRCGEAHAEVNAVNSVAHPEALKDATIYVTLEPCAHYGRTPPCAKLLIDKGIPRVVVGTRDPFGKVDGKGLEMMRSAGIEVIVGILEEECRSLNAVFFTAHSLHRPFVMLKWARSADGYMACRDSARGVPARISTPLTQALVHRLRAGFGGIMVGSSTALTDDPLLDTRLWPGPVPRPVVLDRRHRLESAPSLKLKARNPLIICDDKPLQEILRDIYEAGITSLLVEGGPTLLQAFIDEGIWDVARIETGAEAFGDRGCAKAPHIGRDTPDFAVRIDGNSVCCYTNNPLVRVKNI